MSGYAEVRLDVGIVQALEVPGARVAVTANARQVERLVRRPSWLARTGMRGTGLERVVSGATTAHVTAWTARLSGTAGLTYGQAHLDKLRAQRAAEDAGFLAGLDD